MSINYNTNVSNLLPHQTIINFGNIIEIRECIRFIVKEFIEHYHKWESVQKRGQQLCCSIEKIKTHSIEQFKNSNNINHQSNNNNNDNDDENDKVKDLTEDQNITMYPKELIKPCENLKIIVTILKDIINDSKIIVKQLKELQNTYEKHQQNHQNLLNAAGKISSEFQIKFKTWNLLDILAIIKQIIDLYEKEYKIKSMVMENIAHENHSINNLITYVTIWDFPSFINDNSSKLMIAQLKSECK